MFDSLTSKLEGALKSLSGQGRITEINVAETMGEVRRALLEADVNYQVARSFTNRVHDKALGEEVLRSVAPGQQLVKIVYDELVALLGGTNQEIKFRPPPPTVILVAGLQGSGKTTFCGKLALYLMGQGRAPLLVAADVYRPAAVQQLRMLGNEVGVATHSVTDEFGAIVQDAPRVARESVVAARKSARDVVIIDTAGRMHVDSAMMEEVIAIKRAVKPSEILFVVDSMTGQDAVRTAKAFNRRLDFSGVVLTKLDGDTRGGAALSIRSVVKKPIKYASTGEKLSQLSAFHPDRMARRILGMGDVVTLVEKVQKQVDARQAKAMRRKIRKNQFNFQDLLVQLQHLRSIGSLSDMMSLVPGQRKGTDNPEQEEASLRRMESIILSMTIEERRKPQIITASRRRRIARGSGVKVRDVNDVLKQLRMVRAMMKSALRMRRGGQQVGIQQLMQMVR